MGRTRIDEINAYNSLWDVAFYHVSCRDNTYDLAEMEREDN